MWQKAIIRPCTKAKYTGNIGIRADAGNTVWVKVGPPQLVASIGDLGYCSSDFFSDRASIYLPRCCVELCCEFTNLPPSRTFPYTYAELCRNRVA